MFGSGPLFEVEEDKSDEDEFPAAGSDFCSQEDGGNYDMHVPKKLVELHNGDRSFQVAQQLAQKEALQNIENLYETKDQSIVGQAREMLQITSGRPWAHKHLTAIFEAVINKCRDPDLREEDMLAITTSINDSGRGKKRALPESPPRNGQLEAVPTGKATKKIEPRKRQPWERSRRK